MDFKTSNKFSNYFLDTSIDITREAYKNKNNQLDNKPINRFETDIILNSKESFDSNNQKLNDLQDEISTLKQKLKTIYQKEEEIYKLKQENEKLKKDLTKNQLLTNDISMLTTENKKIRDENDKLKLESIHIQSLQQENQMLKHKLNHVNNSSNDNSSNDNSNNEESSIDINIETKENKENKENKEEISIDINKLKSILFNRLKTYHEQHIDELIKTHDLHNKEKIDKKLMERILLEAIHI